MTFYILHIIHVITVILWIGGLAFVTAIVLPMAIKTPDALQKVLLFQRVEHRFARLARAYNLITGATGLAMLIMMGWHRLLFTRAGIPLTFMTLVWVFWFVMLFGLEPVVIRKMLDQMARQGAQMDIDAIFRRLNRMHWLMVLVSLAAAAAGVLTAHGARPF
jgi:uncharacterized membrane protein